MSKEIEAKFKINDFSFIENMNLIKIKEINVLDIYFDNNLINFRSCDKVLRLRRENDKYYIAYKGPREKHNDFIVREEIEPSISSFEDGFKILKNLDFYEVAKIEKIRVYFKHKDFPSLSITFDNYPFIGLFLEIEGEEIEVYSFISKYNLNLFDSIKKNCTELFLEYCSINNLNFENPSLYFTFEDEFKLKNDLKF